MSKAIMVSSNFSVNPSDSGSSYHLPSGRNGTASGNEALHNITLLADAVFSRIQAGFTVAGSGTTTIVTRKDSVDTADTLVADSSVVGTHAGSTEVSFTSGQKYNLKISDSGTMPTISWLSHLIDLAPDYGSYHVIGLTTISHGSGTRFTGINGQANLQLTAPEKTAFKARGALNIKGFTLIVSTNARPEDVTIDFKINEVTAGSIVISAGATGLFSTTFDATAVEGDLLRYDATTSSGSGSALQIYSLACLILSTTNEVDIGNHVASNVTTTTTYFPLGAAVAAGGASSNGMGVRFGYAGTLRNFRLQILSNSSSTITLKLFKNGVEVASIVTSSTTPGWYEDTSTTVDFSAEDEFYCSIVSDTGTPVVNTVAITASNNEVLHAGVGSASGSSTVSGISPQTVSGIGAVSGGSSVTSVGSAVAQTVGSISGATSLNAEAGPPQPIQAIGLSSAVCNVTGEGSYSWAGVGSSEGRSTVSARGRQVGWRKSSAVSSNWVKQEADI